MKKAWVVVKYVLRGVFIVVILGIALAGVASGFAIMLRGTIY